MEKSVVMKTPNKKRKNGGQTPPYVSDDFQIGYDGAYEHLIAPNGKLSNLTPEQYRLVRTPAFKKWFGDWEKSPETASKVVDENGEPMVVYHGTPQKEKFYDFKIVEGSDKKSKMQLLFGSHFASNLEDANIYKKAKGNIYEVFLNIRNILNLEEHYERSNPKFNLIYEIIKELKIDKKFKVSLDYTIFTNSGDYGGLSKEIQRVFLTQTMLDSYPPKKVFDVLKNKFNGIYYIPYQPQGFNSRTNFSKSFIAFEPNQIKLADGTNTTFDSNNPDIRYNNGGLTMKAPKPKLLAPNGKPSNLTPEQYKLVRTPAFKKWFGDWEKLAYVILKDPAIDGITLGHFTKDVSKVVDENGEPKIMWHGSDSINDIKVFKSKKGYVTNYFASDVWEARRYTSNPSNVKPFFLNCKKFLNTEKLTDTEKRDIKIILSKDEIIDYFITKVRQNQGLNIKAYKEELGYDVGLSNDEFIYKVFSYGGDNWILLEHPYLQEYIVKNNYDGYNTQEGDWGNVAIFNPVNIKLADGTNTTFDGNNPDIRYAKGGGVFNTTPNNHKDIYKNRATVNVNKKEFIFSRLNYTESNVFIIELPSGEEIGRATLNEDGGYLDNIRINENYRRIGLGKLLYEYIEMVTGKPLTPSPIKISIEAKKLWAKRNPNIKFNNGGNTELNLEAKIKSIYQILINELEKYKDETSYDDRWVEIRQLKRKIEGYFEDGAFSMSNTEMADFMQRFTKGLNVGDLDYSHPYVKGELANQFLNLNKINFKVYKAIGDTILFRGVSVEDWVRIQKQGYIDTDMRSAISQYEGINLAQNLKTSIYYLPHNKKGVILAISPKGLDTYMLSDEYVRVFEPIPIENIIRVSEVFTKNQIGTLLSNNLLTSLGNIELKLNEINPNVKYKNGATINNNKMEKPQEKQFDYYKWYKHYNFRAGFGERYSIVQGDNHPESLKYYKTNDVNYVVADTKRILKEKGWNYAEILDKSNDEIALINADGKLHAYKKGSEYWGLKTEEQFEDGGNLENNITYTIGGL